MPEPLAPWFGGKRLLARRIAARVADIPHKCYVEPFVGMGGVILRMPRRALSEVLNDRNAEIVNLFRCVREHPDELCRRVEFLFASRAEFERLLRIGPDALTDIQRAARFLYLQRVCFGGRISAVKNCDGRTYGVTRSRLSRFRPSRVMRSIRLVAERLDTVSIECLDWQECIDRYDTPQTLFYLDPPYHGRETGYGEGLFASGDHAALAERLKRLRGRFLLSLADTPAMRLMFGSWSSIETVATKYSVNRDRVNPVRELLVCGGGGRS